MKKFFISFLLGLSIINIVHSEPNWIYVGDYGDNNLKLYIDDSRIDKTRNRVWIKIDNIPDNSAVKKGYFIQLVETNCSNREYRILYNGLYKKDGVLYVSDVSPSNWKKTGNNTIYDISSMVSCGEKYVSDVIEEKTDNNLYPSEDNVHIFYKEIKIDKGSPEFEKYLILSTVNPETFEKVNEKYHEDEKRLRVRNLLNRFKRVLKKKLTKDEDEIKHLKNLTEDDIYKSFKFSKKIFYKDDIKYFYTETLYDTGFKGAIIYENTYERFKPNTDDVINELLICNSINYPIDITKGKCSEEIQKRFGVKFEKEDLPTMNLH